MKAYVSIPNNDTYFQSDTFGKVLAFVQKNAKTCSFKEVKGQMVITFSAIPSINEGLTLLQKVLK